MGDWARRVPAPGLTVPLVLFLLLRLPSFFEPHWYTDEAGYATTAWLTTHGKVLYLTVWNNKPPLLFWIYDLALTWLGPSEIALHLLSGLAGAVALAGTWMLAKMCLSPGRIRVAMITAAVLLGTPLLNAELALPECFLIAFTVWGMVCLLAARPSRGPARALLLAALAGVLFGAACLIQQTSLADAVAGLLVVGITVRGGWRVVVVGAVLVLVTFGLALVPYLQAAGAHNVFFFLVKTYQGYTAASLHPGLGSIGPRVVVAGLLVWGIWWARHWSPERLLPWVWLVVLLLAYGAPNRAYAHFLLPAVPAGVLILGRATPFRRRRWTTGLRSGPLPLVGAAGVAALIWIGLIVGQLSGGSLFTVKLTAEYYPAFVARIAGIISPVGQAGLYERFPQAEGEALSWLSQHHLRDVTAVVWSADSWPYLLGQLTPVLPVPPIYMDQNWLGAKALVARVRSARPEIVIVTQNTYPSPALIAPLLHSRYTEVEAGGGGQLWLRSDVAASLRAEPVPRSVPSPASPAKE